MALIGIIVWVVRQKQNDSADYFLGGRDATWLAIGASIFASNIGSEHLIGLAGAGASSGMAMAHWEIQGWMILILGWVFVPFYSRSMVYDAGISGTPLQSSVTYHLIGHFSGKLCIDQGSSDSICRRTGIPASIRHQGTLGIDFFWIAAIGLVVLTALYTIFGGMKSVLYTSVLPDSDSSVRFVDYPCARFQRTGRLGREMMRVCGAVTVNDYGDTMTNLIRQRMMRTSWLGALIGSAIIGFWYWCTDQFIVQRVLSGKNEKRLVAVLSSALT